MDTRGQAHRLAFRDHSTTPLLQSRGGFVRWGLTPVHRMTVGEFPQPGETQASYKRNAASGSAAVFAGFDRLAPVAAGWHAASKLVPQPDQAEGSSYEDNVFFLA